MSSFLFRRLPHNLQEPDVVRVAVYAGVDVGHRQHCGELRLNPTEWVELANRLRGLRPAANMAVEGI